MPKNTGVLDFIKKWSDYSIDEWAYFDEKQNIWAIGFEATSHFWQSSVNDVWYEIHFYPNGTVISKGPGVI